MLRTSGTSGSSSSFASNTEDHVKMGGLSWPRWLRGSRSYPIPGRVLFFTILIFILVTLFGLWSIGHIDALKNQLNAMNQMAWQMQSHPQSQTQSHDVQQLQPMPNHPTQPTANPPIQQANKQHQQQQINIPSILNQIEKSSSQVVLPPAPTPITLTPNEIDRLEEPWRWFETSQEHKDLTRKISALRIERGRPLFILDIGLNIGSAPYAINRVCPDCEIIGFEPIPKYFAFASMKLNKAQYPNVALYNYAICDHIGKETIYMDTTNNVGWNTLIVSEKSSSQVGIEIQCVTIDSLIQAKVIPNKPIDLIKIDTEGAEHMVLTGMQETILNHPNPKPWMYIEVGWGIHRKDWGEELKAFQFLFDHGYEPYDMSKITGTSMHWMTPKGLH